MTMFFIIYEVMFSKLQALSMTDAQLLSISFTYSRVLFSNLVGQYALGSLS